MATIITTGAAAITPTIVLGFDTDCESQNNVHPIIGRPIPDVTLRPATSRTGRITLGFHGPTSETDSADAETLLRTPAVFTVVSDDRATLAMSFVVYGRIERRLDDESRDAWTVAVEFREVGA